MLYDEAERSMGRTATMFVNFILLCSIKMSLR